VMSSTTHANLPLVVVHRMEEKLGNMESENQVLRQQTLVLSPTKGLSNRFKSTVFQRTPENGYPLNGHDKDKRTVQVSGLYDMIWSFFTGHGIDTSCVDLDD
jgi:hypothetical protein